MVGALGFEPRASCSQSRRANRAALRPEHISNCHQQSWAISWPIGRGNVFIYSAPHLFTVMGAPDVKHDRVSRQAQQVHVPRVSFRGGTAPAGSPHIGGQARLGL